MSIGRLLVQNPNGLPIVDAEEDVVIEITSADIRKAEAMSPTNCAIARGCKRAIEGVVAATINKSTSYLEFKDKIVRYHTPESATRELISFDRNGGFAAGTYYLKRPPKSARLDRPKRPGGERRSTNDGSRGKRVVPRHVTVMVRGA